MSVTKPRGAGQLPGFGVANATRSAPQIVSFSGKIASTAFGNKIAFVRLDPGAPAEFAVISTSTKGRVHLMNGHGGLKKDVRVTGTAEIGGDSLRAVTVSPVDEH